MAASLFKGTKSRDARALSDAFDFLGIRHSSHVGMESTSVSMRFLPEHQKDAVSLLREVLSEPSFPEAECETAKVQARLQPDAVPPSALPNATASPSMQVSYDSPSVFKRWWFWAAVTAGVGAAAATTYFLTRDSGSGPPDTSLGDVSMAP